MAADFSPMPSNSTSNANVEIVCQHWRLLMRLRKRSIETRSKQLAKHELEQLRAARELMLVEIY
jgi:hypothetical protein